jgi:class 3 adenylate cyclase/tetratricopeptide (TPR) repeat protein
VEVMAVSRRVQTLLFTDIVGSTDRLRELGDAAWAALLVRHHGLIRAVLAAHGGREVNTAGDGFLARFDAPAAALRAAVAAVAAVAPLQMEIRAGLHTGEVELDRDQIAGVGVHLAARVMAQAGPGQVVVSSTVRDLMAGSGLGFVDLGVRELKGFAERWRLFALDPATVRGGQSEPVGWEPLAQDRDGPRVPFPALPSVSPTFVGRAEELQILEAAGRRAADGEPAVVLVGGEAGVGKTRLITELTARCAAQGTRVLAGGCVPVGEGALPYAPIVEALRALLGDLGAGAVRKLVGPSWPELARLLPALGEPDRTGPAEQARLFELLLGLLNRLAEQASLVLVVEDLHWADHSTRDLLAFLVRNLRRERVLLVVTYRNDEPGQQQLGPYLAELDRSGRVERIELRRLDRAQTAAQLAGILGAMPAAELVDAMFARSEGNPFFTEELLAVIRTGSSELPVTLRDLLRGRVQALPQPAQQVLGVVAVAGTHVSHRLLAAAAGLDEAQLNQALREAVANQLLVTRRGEGGYDLRHALLREVIDSDLLPGERARLHATIAAAIAAHPAQTGGSSATTAAELAYHWVAAGELERALPAAVEAGIQAERTFALAEALRHYEGALELWTRVPEAAKLAPLDRITLLERAAEAAHLIHDQPRAVELVRAALTGMDQAADPARAGLLHERLGRYLYSTLDEGALLAYEQAVQLVPGGPPSAERARVLAGYAQILTLLGRDTESRPVAEEALVAARQAGARQVQGRALACLGVALARLGDPDKGLARLREARRIAEEQADAEGLGTACITLTYVLEGAGRLEEALAVALQGAEACRRLGSPGWHSSLRADAGEVEFRLGRWDEADRHLYAVLERDPFIGPHRVHARWERARLDVARGDFDAAHRLLQEADGLAAKAGHAQFDAQFAGPLAIARAELALWEGRDQEAFQAVTDGLAALARVGDEAGFPALYPLGLAATADRAERASARRATSEAKAARSYGDELLARLEVLAGVNPYFPELSTVLAQSRAEHTRLHGRADPAAWTAAVAAGKSSVSPMTRPGRSGGRPRPCWPAGHQELRPKRRCGRRTRPRSGWERRRCDTSWSCSPSAAGYGWRRSPSRHRPRHRRPRWPPPSD